MHPNSISLNGHKMSSNDIINTNRYIVISEFHKTCNVEYYIVHIISLFYKLLLISKHICILSPRSVCIFATVLNIYNSKLSSESIFFYLDIHRVI